MDVAKHAFAEGHYQEALEAAEMAPTAYASDADFTRILPVPISIM